MKPAISNDPETGTTRMQPYLLAARSYDEFLGLVPEATYEWLAVPPPNLDYGSDWLNRQHTRLNRIHEFENEQARVKAEFARQLEAEAIATEKYLQRLREALAALNRGIPRP